MKVLSTARLAGKVLVLRSAVSLLHMNLYPSVICWIGVFVYLSSWKLDNHYKLDLETT